MRVDHSAHQLAGLLVDPWVDLMELQLVDSTAGVMVGNLADRLADRLAGQRVG